MPVDFLKKGGNTPSIKREITVVFTQKLALRPFTSISPSGWRKKRFLLPNVIDLVERVDGFRGQILFDDVSFFYLTTKLVLFSY